MNQLDAIFKIKAGYQVELISFQRLEENNNYR